MWSTKLQFIAPSLCVLLPCGPFWHGPYFKLFFLWCPILCLSSPLLLPSACKLSFQRLLLHHLLLQDLTQLYQLFVQHLCPNTLESQSACQVATGRDRKSKESGFSFAIFKTSNQSSGFFCPRALAISLSSDAQFVQQQTQGTESKWGCRVYKKQIAQLMSWWKLRADSVWKSITSSSEHQIFIMKSGLGLKAVFFSQKRVANLWNLESGCTVNASWTAWVTLAFYTQSTQDSVFCLFFLSLSLIVVVEHNTEITIFWKQQT